MAMVRLIRWLGIALVCAATSGAAVTGAAAQRGLQQVEAGGGLRFWVPRHMQRSAALARYPGMDPAPEHAFSDGAAAPLQLLVFRKAGLELKAPAGDSDTQATRAGYARAFAAGLRKTFALGQTFDVSPGAYDPRREAFPDNVRQVDFQQKPVDAVGEQHLDMAAGAEHMSAGASRASPRMQGQGGISLPGVASGRASTSIGGGGGTASTGRGAGGGPAAAGPGRSATKASRAGGKAAAKEAAKQARKTASQRGGELVKKFKQEGVGTAAGRSSGHGTPHKRAGNQLIQEANKLPKNNPMVEALKVEGRRLINQGKGINH